MLKPRSNSARISVSKLAEFTTARAARQREILRDQKYPADYKVTYYKEATESIASCVANGLQDFSVIYNTVSILEQATPAGIGTQRRINANIDALETFESMLDDIDLKGAAPSLGETSPPKLTCRNVEISVRPEIILRAKGKGSTPLVGAIKLYFIRSFPLTGDAAGYVSAVLQEWTRTFMAADGSVSGPLCYVVDIGSKKVWPGVKATASRLKDIEACCQNISDLWPQIKPDG
nr:hypothetical protein [uncultured Rhodopila sp.]